MRYRSGEIEFDEATAMVRGPHGDVPLRKQVAQTLSVLMTRAPALVSVDELLDAVWGRHAISPSAVPQTIRELRRALGDQAQEPVYIETRHRQGYRWIPPVHVDDGALRGGADRTASPDLATTPADAPVPAVIRARRLPWRTVALLATILMAVLWVVRIMTADAAQHPLFAGADSASWRVVLDAMHTYQLERAERALSALSVEQPATHAMRARIAIQRADGVATQSALRDARARLAADDRPGALLLDALQAFAAGKEAQAWQQLEPLIALRPDDADLKLMAWGLRKSIPSERAQTMAEELVNDERVPVPMRALIAAQLASARGDALGQQAHAQRCVDAFGQDFPEIAAFARSELAKAAEARAEIDLTQELALESSQALEQHGLYRGAVRALSEAVWNAMAQGKFDLAETHLARMQRLLDGRSDPVGVVLVRHYRALMFSRRNDDRAALEAFLQLAADYEAVDNPRSAAIALNSALTPLYRQGRNEEVPAIIDRALTLATRAQAHDTVGYLHGALGNHYIRLGDLERGNTQLLRALESFRVREDRKAEADALGNLGELALMRARLHEARQYTLRALELHERLGNKSGKAFAYSRLADLDVALGALDPATAHLERSIAGFAELGQTREHAMMLRAQGTIQLRRVELDAARRAWQALSALSDKNALAQAEFVHLGAEIDFFEGRIAPARAAFERAAVLWREGGEPNEALAATAGALRARLAQGEWVAVEEETRMLLKRPELKELRAVERDARLMLAQSLIAQQRRADAEAALNELDRSLSAAPNAEDALHAALIRASLDLNANTRRERLGWIAEQAQSQGMDLLALDVRGALARETGPAALSAWQTEVARTGARVLIDQARPAARP